jgi:hypothetical protein
MNVSNAGKYVIESTMRGTSKGGNWAGPWTTHTTLAATSLREARAEFRKFIRMWLPEARQHFRLARHWGAKVTILTA